MSSKDDNEDQNCGKKPSLDGEKSSEIENFNKKTKVESKNAGKVSAESLENDDPVSRPVVEQMALGAVRVLGCDCSVATSGIAGPGGGTEVNPVGTVWIAVAYKEQVFSSCFYFGENREDNIRQASDTALQMLIDLLKRDS